MVQWANQHQSYLIHKLEADFWFNRRLPQLRLAVGKRTFVTRPALPFFIVVTQDLIDESKTFIEIT